MIDLKVMNGRLKYFRKPLVEAIQFVGSNWQEVKDWCGVDEFQEFGKTDQKDKFLCSAGCLRSGLSTRSIVELNDWIINTGHHLGPKYSIMTPDDFEFYYQIAKC